MSPLCPLRACASPGCKLLAWTLSSRAIVGAASPPATRRKQTRRKRSIPTSPAALRNPQAPPVLTGLAPASSSDGPIWQVHPGLHVQYEYLGTHGSTCRIGSETHSLSSFAALTPGLAQVAASPAARAFAFRWRCAPWPRRAEQAQPTCPYPTSRARPTPAAQARRRQSRAISASQADAVRMRSEAHTVWSFAHCIAGASPVYTNQSGPAPPPAHPTIPRVISGP